jgi:hypothetical protein
MGAIGSLRLFFGSVGACAGGSFLAFVSSSSENISCITFLKYNNSRKQELAGADREIGKDRG